MFRGRRVAWRLHSDRRNDQGHSFNPRARRLAERHLLNVAVVAPRELDRGVNPPGKKGRVAEWRQRLEVREISLALGDASAPTEICEHRIWLIFVPL